MQGLQHQSEEVATLLRDVTQEAHEASGLLAAQADTDDAKNLMAVLEDLPLVKKLAIIEWFHRTMV